MARRFENGAVFAYNFPAGSALTGIRWPISRSSAYRQEVGGFDNAERQEISLLLSRSPYGKEPDPECAVAGKKHGLSTRSGHEPRRRQSRNGWRPPRTGRTCLLWAGRHGTAGSQEAAGRWPDPRRQSDRCWCRGAEPDVTPAGDHASATRPELQHVRAVSRASTWRVRLCKGQGGVGALEVRRGSL